MGIFNGRRLVVAADAVFVIDNLVAVQPTTGDRTGHLFGRIGVTSRKAPAFLQGLLQFDFSLERETGIEPAILCLGIVSKWNQAVPRCPWMVKPQMAALGDVSGPVLQGELGTEARLVHQEWLSGSAHYFRRWT
jgi:hypothetical protein